MTAYADLEIGLHRRDDASYRVEARLRRPGSDAPIEPPSGEEVVIQLDPDDLKSLAEAAYGQQLAARLFAPRALQTLFAKARQATKGHDPPLPLRLRLRIGASAPELHQVRWELMHDPEQPGRLLATDENTPFSRYLPSSDERPVGPRPRDDLKALVAVANPANLGDYRGEDGQRLESVNVAAELTVARNGLASTSVTALCSFPGLACDGRPTLNDIVAQLREGPDILYLVCHGALSKDGIPLLFLEDAQRKNDVVTADDGQWLDGQPIVGLVSQLDQLQQLPRLVILASCQSAGDGGEWASRDTRALSTLGPRLAEAGVPAVLAMQGSITMETVSQFMPIFFEELQRDGQIDRAMAAARRAVHDRWDWWVPVLFTRLESGRLFASAAADVQTAVDASAVDAPTKTGAFDLGVVEELLLAAFTAEDLRRLVYYSSNEELRRLANRFGLRDGLVDMVLTTIEYCEKRGLLSALLAEVERENPRQYDRFRHRLRT